MFESLASEIVFPMTLLSSCFYYFLVCSCATITKILYDNLVGKGYRTKIERILLGGLIGAFTMPSVEIHFKFPPEIMLLLSFFIGILSFELFGKLSNIQGFKETVKDIVEVSELLKNKKLENENLIHQEKEKLEYNMNIERTIESPVVNTTEDVAFNIDKNNSIQDEEGEDFY